jgi:GIY-YIG catalytic domain
MNEKDEEEYLKANKYRFGSRGTRYPLWKIEWASGRIAAGFKRRLSKSRTRSRTIDNGERAEGRQHGDRDPGVYIIWIDAELVYVGKSHHSIKARMRGHLNDRKKRLKIGGLKVMSIIFGTRCEPIIDYLEAILIRELKPRMNKGHAGSLHKGGFKKIESDFLALVAICQKSQGEIKWSKKPVFDW